MKLRPATITLTTGYTQWLARGMTTTLSSHPGVFRAAATPNPNTAILVRDGWPWLLWLALDLFDGLSA